MIRYFLLLIFLIGCSCKVIQDHKIAQVDNSGSSTPMSCKIKGEIMQEMIISDEKSNICSKYPCKAKVKILEVSDCGSSVSIPVNSDDIIEINFAYTLHNTSTIFPGMKTQYPGLNIGDHFIANATERLKMGGPASFTIYDYQIINEHK